MCVRSPRTFRPSRWRTATRKPSTDQILRSTVATVAMRPSSHGNGVRSIVPARGRDAPRGRLRAHRRRRPAHLARRDARRVRRLVGSTRSRASTGARSGSPRRRLRGAARVHLGRAARRHAALVSRRALARVHVQPRQGREDAGATVRHPRRGRRGAPADRPQGERREDRVVARLDAHRLHRARARRRVRRGGRPQARAAPVDAPLLQARQRRLDDRPAHASLRRRPRRRRRAAADHRRRLRGRRARAGRRTGSASSSRALRGERWDIELVARLYVVDADGGEPKQLTRRRRVVRHAGVLARRLAHRLPYGREDGTFPHHGQIGVMRAGRRRPRVLDDVARPAVHAVPRLPRAAVGRRPDRLHDRGRRQHAPLRRRRRRLGAAGAARRRRALDRRATTSRDGTLAYVASTHTTLRELFVRRTRLTGRTSSPADRA